MGYCIQVPGCVPAEVGALGEVLAQQAIGVFVRAALPGALRISEVYLQPGVNAQAGVLCHFRSLVPGQRLAQLLRKSAHGPDDGLADRFGSVAGKWRSIVNGWALLIAIHPRQVQQHCEAGSGVVVGTHQRATDLKFRKQPLVVDVKAKCLTVA
jgi:hypothetical protein